MRESGRRINTNDGQNKEVMGCCGGGLDIFQFGLFDPFSFMLQVFYLFF